VKRGRSTEAFHQDLDHTLKVESTDTSACLILARQGKSPGTFIGPYTFAGGFARDSPRGAGIAIEPGIDPNAIDPSEFVLSSLEQRSPLEMEVRKRTAQSGLTSGPSMLTIEKTKDSGIIPEKQSDRFTGSMTCCKHLKQRDITILSGHGVGSGFPHLNNLDFVAAISLNSLDKLYQRHVSIK
jgi:hypothetical protein